MYIVYVLQLSGGRSCNSVGVYIVSVYHLSAGGSCNIVGGVCCVCLSS